MNLYKMVLLLFIIVLPRDGFLMHCIRDLLVPVLSHEARPLFGELEAHGGPCVDSSSDEWEVEDEPEEPKLRVLTIEEMLEERRGELASFHVLALLPSRFKEFICQKFLILATQKFYANVYNVKNKQQLKGLFFEKIVNSENRNEWKIQTIGSKRDAHPLYGFQRDFERLVPNLAREYCNLFETLVERRIVLGDEQGLLKIRERAIGEALSAQAKRVGTVRHKTITQWMEQYLNSREGMIFIKDLLTSIASGSLVDMRTNYECLADVH